MRLWRQSGAMGDPQRANLAHPEAGAVRDHDDRAVLDRGDRVEELGDLRSAEDHEIWPHERNDHAGIELQSDPAARRKAQEHARLERDEVGAVPIRLGDATTLNRAPRSEAHPWAVTFYRARLTHVRNARVVGMSAALIQGARGASEDIDHVCPATRSLAASFAPAMRSRSSRSAISPPSAAWWARADSARAARRGSSNTV